jgi:signal transduction histidine kinase/ligand-binding sensor domain-containing protein
LNKSLLLNIFIFFAGSIFSQTTNEAGNPFIKNYSTQETGADVQVWSFVEDNRGVMYIGTTPGLIEYDGSNWRMIEVGNKSFARSMSIDDNNRIYIGASSDFGYLDSRKNGELYYVSLLDQLNSEDKVFSYVWTTIVTEEGIYFQTFDRIFRFNPIVNSKDDSELAWDIKIWKPEGKFNFSFYLDDTYYVMQGDVGLMKMVDDSLVMLPGGEQFKNDRLQVMLPYNTNGDKKYLVGTFNTGLYLFDGSSFTRFEGEANSYLKEHTLYRGRTLSDGSFGFATLTGGFVIMEADGKNSYKINLESGLPNNTVLEIFVDSHGLVWLAPENSISIIDYPSPMSVFDASLGVNGTPYDILRHNDILYIATSNGIFYLNEEESIIKPVNGLVSGNAQTFSLLSISDQMLATVGTGLYKVKGDKATMIKKTTGTTFLSQFLHRSKVDTNRIFVALIDGLSSFHLAGNGSDKWNYEGLINGVSEYVTSIVETEPGVMWLGTDSKGTLKLNFNQRPFNDPLIERFGFENNLPPGGCYVNYIAGDVIFLASDGTYRFERSDNSFKRDTLTNVVQVGNISSSPITEEEKNGNIWVNFGKETALLKLGQDGQYQIDRTAYQRLSNYVIVQIYPEENGIVWFGTNENLIRYDSKIAKNYSADFNALMRKVIIGEDSLLFGGFGKLGNGYLPTLEFENNSLRFEYSATSYDEPSATQYQSMLAGFDERWSVWTKEVNRNYTNLPAGEYIFSVRAKNIYKHQSNEASFSFKIFPPWYRSWWAYVLYVFILVTGIFAVDRIQRKRLTRKERERAEFREAKLRAEAAEANSKTLEAENERKKNIELLSEVGKDITARLTIKSIIDTVYENVNTMMDATVFGIGIHNEEKNSIDFPATKEKGETLPNFYNSLDDENRPAVWSFKNQQEIFTNDYSVDYHKYIKELQEPAAGQHSESIIYLPLSSSNKTIGVITAQSFKKNAYTDYHLNILRNLATYTAIALDNAEAYTKLNETVDDLKSTQEQLVLQEKLASLGQLTAGIAHEIKNPLNFINNFAQLTLELIQDLREELISEKSKVPRKRAEEIESLLKDLELNAAKINEHGKRADSIVKSMLQHSRGKSGEKQFTDINAMLEEDLNLAFHGMRAQDTTFNVKMKKEFDKTIGSVNIVPQDISRVILNIISNSFYEVHKKKKNAGDGFKPEVTVRSKDYTDKIEIVVRDNGNGIPEGVKDKLFNPFFTTKPAGEGTGLGLSLSYDIVSKGHNGDITFESELGKFTEFKITLPKNSN